MVGPAGCADPLAGEALKKGKFKRLRDIQHATCTTEGGLADSIASRIPPGHLLLIICALACCIIVTWLKFELAWEGFQEGGVLNRQKVMEVFA